jgi:hypothetical protein
MGELFAPADGPTLKLLHCETSDSLLVLNERKV